MLSVNNYKFFIAVIGSASLLFLPSACSISNGAGSASDSSGSFAKSSESISTSSESSSNSDKGSKTSQYQNGIIDFTANYIRATPNVSDHNNFMKGLSDVAGQNGIVDWEANPKTYRAIGLGLKGGQLPKQNFNVLAQQITNGNHTKLLAIQQGYQN